MSTGLGLVKQGALDSWLCVAEGGEELTGDGKGFRMERQQKAQIPGPGAGKGREEMKQGNESLLGYTLCVFWGAVRGDLGTGTPGVAAFFDLSEKVSEAF